MTVVKAEWRNLLIEHIDGGVPIRRHGSALRQQMMAALIVRGWIREGHRSSGRGVSTRPEMTYLTEVGRMVLAKALGDWADSLARREAALLERFSEVKESAPSEAAE